MSLTAKNGKNHTLLCLMSIYGIHGFLFYVFPHSIAMTNDIKPMTINPVIENYMDSDTLFLNQGSHVEFTVKNTVQVNYYSVNFCRNKKKILDNSMSKVNSSLNQVLHYEKEIFKNEASTIYVNVCLSSEWIQDLVTSTATASRISSITAILFSDVSVLISLNPSTLGIFIGCLIFLFTSKDSEKHDKRYKKQ